MAEALQRSVVASGRLIFFDFFKRRGGGDGGHDARVGREGERSSKAVAKLDLDDRGFPTEHGLVII